MPAMSGEIQLMWHWSSAVYTRKTRDSKKLQYLQTRWYSRWHRKSTQNGSQHGRPEFKDFCVSPQVSKKVRDVRPAGLSIYGPQDGWGEYHYGYGKAKDLRKNGLSSCKPSGWHKKSSRGAMGGPFFLLACQMCSSRVSFDLRFGKNNLHSSNSSFSVNDNRRPKDLEIWMPEAQLPSKRVQA